VAVSDRKAIERRLDSYRQQHFRAFDKLDPGFGINKKSLTLAAQFFGFDLERFPMLREVLLYILADVLFGRRKKGRPKGSHAAWDFNRHFRLFQLYHLKKRDNPQLSRAGIAKLICEHEEFKNNDPEQVRQHIGRALREHEEFARRCREFNKTSNQGPSRV
jgi:hypothetical protein